MPSLKDIRKRIGSVKNTQKITRAMKLVAAAKLRRAQDSIIAARPYANSLEAVVSELASRAGDKAHPLLEARASKRATIIMLTSDRGLAGAFNSQIIRAVEAYVEKELSDFTDVSLRIVGRKGNAYFKRRDANIRSYVGSPTSKTALDLSREIANNAISDFKSEEVDHVFLVYNEFKSAMSQDVVIRQILPIIPTETPADEPTATDGGVDFLYEPSKEELLDHLVPLYVQVGLYRAALESLASELGARMSAMDSATRNAGEMIDKLTLQYNRARQAAITKELLEIISGAEALKG
jgi:F-type H+-transporting ATPase subunit gamma